MVFVVEQQKKQEQWTIPASEKTTEDPLLDCLVLLSEHYGNPCSGEALLVGLPLNNAQLTPELFSQAASRIGLVAKLLRKPLETLSPLVLPCILLLNNKKACILREIIPNQDKVIIQLPENGGESEIAISELNNIYTGYAFLVKQQYRGDKSIDVNFIEQKGHWLWSLVKDASPIYRDALLASILINIFVLVSPLFMMNVYDKIVPNLAFESLWVLASGVALVFTFDFILRHMRSYLIDLAGKKIDIIVSSQLFAKVLGIPLAKKGLSVGATAKQIGEFDSIRDMLTSVTLTTLVDLPFAALFLVIIYLVAGDLALIPLCAGILIIGYSLWVQPKLKFAVTEANKYSTIKHAHLIESLTAAEAIKSNVAEGIMQRSWQQMNAHTADWQLKLKKLSN
ncbi:TPA: ABC transporter transmembrane domain-containing protein, partial [Photobacterium damselae]